MNLSYTAGLKGIYCPSPRLHIMKMTAAILKYAQELYSGMHVILCRPSTPYVS